MTNRHDRAADLIARNRNAGTLSVLFDRGSLRELGEGPGASSVELSRCVEAAGTRPLRALLEVLLAQGVAFQVEPGKPIGPSSFRAFRVRFPAATPGV
jgi:hypothetical protein